MRFADDRKGFGPVRNIIDLSNLTKSLGKMYIKYHVYIKIHERMI